MTTPQQHSDPNAWSDPAAADTRQPVEQQYPDAGGWDERAGTDNRQPADHRQRADAGWDDAGGLETRTGTQDPAFSNPSIPSTTQVPDQYGDVEQGRETMRAPDDLRGTTAQPVMEPGAAPDHAARDDQFESLFGHSDLGDLKNRWNDVQAGFVDDPRQCVQQADGLVSDVVDQLTAGFSQARSRLEEQWARGEEASTEDLRVALKRYREFFDRLLAV